MAHKKSHGPAPVPPANRPQAGPPTPGGNAGAQGHPGGGAPLQDQDAKRRLGDFEGEGEHSRQQPSAANDGQQHSR